MQNVKQNTTKSYTSGRKPTHAHFMSACRCRESIVERIIIISGRIGTSVFMKDTQYGLLFFCIANGEKNGIIQ